MKITQKSKQSLKLLLGCLGIAILWLPLTVWAANLLQVDGMEAPFVKYGEWAGGGITFDLEVAHDWEKFFIAAGTYDNGNKIRYMKASAVEFLFGSVEKRDGADAQIWWSTKPFEAGIYQQVSGLTVDEYYGFQAGILQVFANTSSKTHNKMFRSVGIDPYGGVNPSSSNVIWSPEEGLDVDWFYPGVGVQAKSSTITVFIRVRSIDDAPQYEENSVWADDPFMDVAPTTTLDLTIDSPTQVTAAWNGAPRPGFHLFAYEAQYREAAAETWINLQIFDSSTEPVPTGSSASLAVEPGVTYVVRARTWHEQDGDDDNEHEVPGPWVEKTITVGGLISGYTLDNRGHGFGNVTVTVNGSSPTTTSDGTGRYNLATGPGTFGLTAYNNSGWTAPQPVTITVSDLETIVPLTITLRPPDDVISNGDFKNGSEGLTNWQVSGITPTRVISGRRSGDYSLALTGTVTLSQTGFITGSYQPVLSFWYKVHSGDGDDIFTAEILGTAELTAANSFSTTTIGGWQYTWLPLDLSEVYTGPVGVRFYLSQSGPTQTVVYLDEVSLGRSAETNKNYLPLILK